VITLLNNLSQPLAGLLVGFLAAPMGLRGVILLLALFCGLLGVAVAVTFKARVVMPVES
jgi:hypothetical protein